MLPKYDVLTPEQVQQVHEQTMKILEEMGIVFDYEPALEVFKAQGQRVEGKKVYFQREFIEAQVKKAPTQFTLHARNPEKNVVIGGENIVFNPGYGVPFVFESDGSKRSSVMADYDNFVKLAGASENLHMTGHNVVEPNDIPEESRHLTMIYSHIKNADKCFMGSATGKENAQDSVELASILFGGKDVIKEKPVLITLINSITPLMFDDRMLGALMAYAEAGQAVLISSLGMAGSTAPASLAGGMTLQNAEVLAGIALAQCINPGTPVVYGAPTAIADMRSVSLSIGNPETALFTSAAAQLARYYEVPSRGGGGLTDSKIADAQAGYESMMTLMAAGAAGINYVLHTAGIMMNYTAMSYEKFMIDDEIAGMVLRYIKGINFSEEKLAYDVIKNVGSGGHFLMEMHTMQHHREELRMPQLSDRQTHDNWSKDKLDTNQRANVAWKKVLENYEAPALDPAIDQALQDFINKRTAELNK